MSGLRNRTRAESAERLSAAELRRYLNGESSAIELADGSRLELGWQPVRGCYGGARGGALTLVCPVCGRGNCRVLWRPPGEGWGCCRCWVITHPSHRRSGSRAGKPKPASWSRAKYEAEMEKVAEMLGFQRWRGINVLNYPPGEQPFERGADAPLLRRPRHLALLQRMVALAVLSFPPLIPEKDGKRQASEENAIRASREVLVDTAWAMRRPARDPRSALGPRRCQGES
jgi:hypothetical protein